MCKVLLFVDMEFPRGRGDQMEKSWKFQGVVGGSTMKPLGMENPGGWGVKLEKTLHGGGGGMDIFWNHTIKRLTSSNTIHGEGGIRVGSDVVLCYFWSSFVEICILTCGITVL